MKSVYFTRRIEVLNQDDPKLVIDTKHNLILRNFFRILPSIKFCFSPISLEEERIRPANFPGLRLENPPSSGAPACSTPSAGAPAAAPARRALRRARGLPLPRLQRGRPGRRRVRRLLLACG